jgi:hypothetical protein
MTSIGTVQNSLAAKLAQQRAAEMASALGGAPSQTQQAGAFATSLQTTPTPTASSVTGGMQPPLSSPTVTALLSAQQNATTPGLSASDSMQQYSNLTDDEQNLPTVEKDFLNYARETPAQKMEDAILKEEGLTKADLQNMDPQKRAKVEQDIAEKVKERMQNEMESKASGAPGSSAPGDLVSAV